MLNELLKKYDLEEFKNEFESLVKQCWAGEAYKRKHEKGESKVGGLPDAPEGFVWPVFKGLPLEFICQIKCSEVDLTNFPKDGLLLFFVCDGYWTDKIEDKDYIRVVYVPESACLVETKPPFIYKKRLFGLLKPREIPKVFDEARLKISRSISLPDPESLNPDFAKKMDLKDECEGYCEIKEEISGERFIQIGGYPHPIQYDGIAESAAKAFGFGEAKDWHMILEVSFSPQTNMMWGDGGRLHFFAHKADIENRKFDNVWMEFQCH